MCMATIRLESVSEVFLLACLSLQAHVLCFGYLAYSEGATRNWWLRLRSWWLLVRAFYGDSYKLFQSKLSFDAGCGSLAVARVDNLYQLWGLLVLAGLGIGGIVVPASIITTIICPDVRLLSLIELWFILRTVNRTWSLPSPHSHSQSVS